MIAEDAANAIEAEYEALPSVIDAEKALEPGAPLAREELDSNICYVATKKGGDVDKAFAQAEHICRMPPVHCTISSPSAPTSPTAKSLYS